MGLDLSVTRTGLAVSEAVGGKLILLHKESVKIEGHGINRAIDIANEIVTRIAEHRPEIVVIEGYAYGNKFSLATLVELGTMVRWGVVSIGRYYLDPAPTQLKKFLTGDGGKKTNKKKMVEAVKNRWGIEKVNHDEADAIGLSAMGLAYLNLLPCSKGQREILMSCKKHFLATSQ